VTVGANVAPGQLVEITTLVEHAPLARALSRASFEAGARYVDVLYNDNHERRARVELGPDGALTWTPPGRVERLRHLGETRGASIATTGDPEPHLLDDVPGERVGRARLARSGRRVDGAPRRAATAS
jgi:aminopeptidase